FAVDAAVLLEIGRPEGGPHVGDVAKRPQALVGETRVITVLLFLRKPDAANLVERMFGWHGNPVVAVDGLAIAGTAAVRDPCTGAGAHHRLACGDKAPRGTLHPHAGSGGHVDARLAAGAAHDGGALQCTAARA